LAARARVAPDRRQVLYLSRVDSLNCFMLVSPFVLFFFRVCSFVRFGPSPYSVGIQEGLLLVPGVGSRFCGRGWVKIRGSRGMRFRSSARGAPAKIAEAHSMIILGVGSQAFDFSTRALALLGPCHGKLFCSSCISFVSYVSGLLLEFRSLFVISEGPTCVGSKVWAFPSRQQMTSAFVLFFFNPLFLAVLVFLENRWRTGSPVAVGFF